jgi:hypothetical protein
VAALPPTREAVRGLGFLLSRDTVHARNNHNKSTTAPGKAFGGDKE